jgi:hypothetical protein
MINPNIVYIDKHPIFMRITGTFWIILGMLAFCAILSFAIDYGSTHLDDQTIETIKTLSGAVFILVVGVPIMYIVFSGFFATVNEYATGIFEIFLDANDKDIHVFTYHNDVNRKSRGGSSRLIQHYFMVADTGKSYYSVLFSHSTESRPGYGGYEGFDSFGKSVLQSEVLKAKLAELSEKVGRELDLGELLRKGTDDQYPIGDRRALLIGQKEKLYTKQLTVVYKDVDLNRILWKNKI